MASKKKEQPAAGGRLPRHFVFKSGDLYLRNGFQSGAILSTAFPHLGRAELRDLLTEVLQTHVIPQLDQSVQTLAIPTVHNPLRAVNADGTTVRWDIWAGKGPALTPETVKLSLEDVLACARRKGIALPAAA